MTLLVFGKTGQVATELQQQGDVIALSRVDADLMDPDACARIIAETNATAIVNAAAFTDVDRAESESEIAYVVNGLTPTAMARAAAIRGLPFIHISSDYVFDGAGETAHHPNSITDPINTYGHSKLLGEQGILSTDGQSVILRTSWIFSPHGKNFLTTMLRLGANCPELNIVADQIGGPTPASTIASAIFTIADKMANDPKIGGIFHFSGSPDVSWAEFACAIFRESSTGVRVNPITTAEYPTPANRPLNSRLDCSLTFDVFELRRPDWLAGVRNILKDLD